MKPSLMLEQHRDTIRRIVTSHRASQPRVFGSVLSATDNEQSDLDILVEPGADTSLLDIARIQVELEEALGIRVDVLTPKALPSEFRDRVLNEARFV
jgi:predicted nucleotidyltransferase